MKSQFLQCMFSNEATLVLYYPFEEVEEIHQLLPLPHTYQCLGKEQQSGHHSLGHLLGNGG